MTVSEKILALLAGFLLAGCASPGPTLADCKGADWVAIGETDGRAGAPSKDNSKRAENCLSLGAEGALTAYHEGRARGLASYCSADGGFSAGAKGADYEGVCSSEREAEFLAGYVVGETLFKLAEGEQKAIVHRSEAEKDLDQHRFLLKAAEKRAAKSTISNEDRESARQEAAYRTREIARLEQNLPKLAKEIEAARKALDDFKAKLIDEGREF